MFLQHFKLREQPFGVTPDPRFLMDTPSHREAWATLLYGIESGRGFLSLVAPPGLGKTTLLFRLLEELRGRTKTAFLFQTQCDSDEFLTLLLNDLEDIPRPGAGVAAQESKLPPDLHMRCERALTETHADGAAILIQQGRSLVCTATVGVAPPLGSVAEIDVGLSGESFTTRRTISCENSQVDQRLSLESRQTLPFASFLIAPLCSHNHVVGVVEVFSLRKSAFGVTERATLYELGGEKGADDGGLQARPAPICGRERAALHEALHATLLRESEKGVPPVLIVDEAQNLDCSVLETIRLLSDFETSRSKLLQVILAGQSQLRDRLSSPGLVQLHQRISMMTELAPLSSIEVRDYISHRLRIAGYSGPPLFTPEACNLVAELSSGIPRNINNICFHAMSLAYATGTTKIGTEVLLEVSTDVNWGTGNNLGPEITRARTGKSSSRTAQGTGVGDDDRVEPAVKGSLSRMTDTDRPLFEEVATQIDSAPKRSYVRKLKDTFAAMLACAFVIFLLGGFLGWRRGTFARRPPVYKAGAVLGHAALSSQGGSIATSTAAQSAMPGSAAVPAIEHRRKRSQSHAKSEDRSSSRQANTRTSTLASSPVSPSTATSAEHPPSNFVASLSPSKPSEIPVPTVEETAHPEELLPSNPVNVRPEKDADPPASTNTGSPSAADARTSIAQPGVEESSSVVEAALVKMVPPTYPALARQAKLEGNVVLSAFISKEGAVKKVRVISGNRTLADAAVHAVRQWRYEASLVNGQPEAVWKTVVVSFNLNTK